MSSPTRPLILGHRGASAHASENTISAFALALEHGADGFECDVHLTADGEIVVHHDDTVDRLTNGQGKISAMTLAQLQRLRIATPYHAESAHAQIPTLAEVIDRFGHQARLINIEIKPSWTTTLADAVGKFVTPLPVKDNVLISSFDTNALLFLQQRYPQLRRAMLYPPYRYCWGDRQIWPIQYLVTRGSRPSLRSCSSLLAISNTSLDSPRP
jgi:glycerophosphoryl diester phosphodiesterase